DRELDRAVRPAVRLGGDRGREPVRDRLLPRGRARRARRAARRPIDRPLTMLQNRRRRTGKPQGGSMRRNGWVRLGVVAAGAAIATATVLATTAGASTKLTSVTLQLKWVTQAQFAGYYAAVQQGFYKNAGLDVKLKVGGPNITPEQVVIGGGA